MFGDFNQGFNYYLESDGRAYILYDIYQDREGAREQGEEMKDRGRIVSYRTRERDGRVGLYTH